MFLFGKAYVNVTNEKKEYVMNELWKGSGRKMSAGKQCLLLSLGGFLLGILFFWLFKNSFVEELRKMNESVSVTAKQGQPLLAAFFYVVLERSKSFWLLWIFSTSKLRLPYIMFFITYKGVGLGFLYSFFILEYKLLGLRFCLYYLFPHMILLIPVFLLSFFKIVRQNRNHMALTIIILYVLLLASCFLEVRFNLPLMGSLY